MGCGSKCGSGSKHLCPFSLGLALGITCFLAVIIWMLWVMYYGPTPMMMTHDMVMPNTHNMWLVAVWALIKGFIFGFVVALIYDFFACCFRRCRCGGRCDKCGVDCKCGETCRCGGHCNCKCCDKTKV